MHTQEDPVQIQNYTQPFSNFRGYFELRTKFFHVNIIKMCLRMSQNKLPFKYQKKSDKTQEGK